MSAILIFLLAVGTMAQAPPNATACTVGVSLCNGQDQNCICQHAGVCNGPSFTDCTCPSPDSWTGTYCHLASCVGINFPNGCVHGFCNTPGECKCDPGWKGYDCSIPLPCTPGVSVCTGPCACLNNGTCGGPQNVVCTCPSGYASDYCEVASCNGPDFPGGCQHGKCASPNVCVCNPGWNGTDCSKAICDPPCAHGSCTAPNTCDCFNTGYAHCPGGPEICGCDENECQRGERPCDPIVTCNNFIGSFNCTDCPPGSPGQPYLTYPLSPANKTYFEGGCSSPRASTGVPVTTASPTTAQATTAQATTAQATTAAATTAAATETSATTGQGTTGEAVSSQDIQGSSSQVSLSQTQASSSPALSTESSEIEVDSALLLAPSLALAVALVVSL